MLKFRRRRCLPSVMHRLYWRCWFKLYQGYCSYSRFMSVLTLEVTMFKHYTTETMHWERNMAKLEVGFTKREQFYIVTRLIVFRIWKNWYVFIPCIHNNAHEMSPKNWCSNTHAVYKLVGHLIVFKQNNHHFPPKSHVFIDIIKNLVDNSLTIFRHLFVTMQYMNSCRRHNTPRKSYLLPLLNIANQSRQPQQPKETQEFG